MLKASLDDKLQGVLQSFKDTVEILVAKNQLGVLKGSPSRHIQEAAKQFLIEPLAEFMKTSEANHKPLYDAYVDASVYRTSICTAAQDNGADAADLAFLMYRESLPAESLKVSKKLKKMREKRKR